MRLTHFTTLAIAAALGLASCSNTEETKAPPVPTGAAPSAINVEAASQAAPIELSPNAAAPATGVALLNPPHGEPGHRCEIPVGAPLDGSAPPSADNMPISVNIPEASPVAAPALPSSGNSGKINPPHGEPGHDCAVPVGSPLP